MNQKEYERMKEIYEKSSSFIKEISAPIKTRYAKDTKEYLQEFIKFPGALVIISILFANSNLVKTKELALTGVVLVVIALLIALNILRRDINSGRSIFTSMLETENLMVNFNRRFVLYSKDRSDGNEKHLTDAYDKFEEAYDEEAIQGDSIVSGVDFVFTQINVSFYILILGTSISFLSIFDMTWIINFLKALC